MKRVKEYILSKDERGFMKRITNETWGEINYIETYANQVRGNHYHKKTHELFFIISGEIDVRVQNIKSGKCEKFLARKGDTFIIEPYDMHTFHVKTDSQWINVLSQKRDDDNPDFYAE